MFFSQVIGLRRVCTSSVLLKLSIAISYCSRTASSQLSRASRCATEWRLHEYFADVVTGINGNFLRNEAYDWYQNR